MIRNHFVIEMFLVSLLIGAMPVLAQYDQGQTAFDAKEYASAKSAWESGAAAGDSRSQYSLGYLAQFGLAGPADLGVARAWYEKSAQGGNADALYALGLMYESGDAGGRDLGRAFDLYRRAAAAGGQSDAEYALGRMLLRGRGVARNAAESVRWLKISAERGNPAAAYLLAESFESGWGMPVNDGEAYYWYRRADQGDPVELQDQDAAFAPKIAIDALRRRLPADVTLAIDTRLRKELSPAAKPKGTREALTAPAK